MTVELSEKVKKAIAAVKDPQSRHRRIGHEDLLVLVEAAEGALKLNACPTCSVVLMAGIEACPVCAVVELASRPVQMVTGEVEALALAQIEKKVRASATEEEALKLLAEEIEPERCGCDESLTLRSTIEKMEADYASMAGRVVSQRNKRRAAEEMVTTLREQLATRVARPQLPEGSDLAIKHAALEYEMHANREDLSKTKRERDANEQRAIAAETTINAIKVEINAPDESHGPDLVRRVKNVSDAFYEYQKQITRLGVWMEERGLRVPLTPEGNKLAVDVAIDLLKEAGEWLVKLRDAATPFYNASGRDPEVTHQMLTSLSSMIILSATTAAKFKKP